MTGGWVSSTVTVNWHSIGCPLRSTVLQVTVVTPIGKVDPDGGLQVGAGGGSQVSETMGGG